MFGFFDAGRLSSAAVFEEEFVSSSFVAIDIEVVAFTARPEIHPDLQAFMTCSANFGQISHSQDMVQR